MMFPITACRAGLFQRALIHVLWRWFLWVPIRWFPMRFLPHVGCYGYAEDRRDAGFQGCKCCEPAPTDQEDR
jgi:hypothetical protein